MAGLGRRQSWLLGGSFVIFCVDDKKQTENSYCSGFFSSRDLSFSMGKKEGKEEEWQEGKKTGEM